MQISITDKMGFHLGEFYEFDLIEYLSLLFNNSSCLPRSTIFRFVIPVKTEIH